MDLEGSAVEGEISTPTMSVRLENYSWGNPFEIDYRIPEFALFRTLTRTPSCSQVTPVSKGHWSADFEGLGFWPAAEPLHFKSSRRSLRIIYCRFPPRRLETLTGFGTAWDVRDTKSCFGLRNPRLDRAVLGLGAEVLQPGFASSLIVEGTGMMLAAELARHVQRQYGAIEFKKGGLSPRQLGRIMDFIGDTDEGCPTIAELSQLCGISERHLMRAFKDATGITIGAHVEQVRSARAQDLLHQDLAIKTIGARLGFSSASHFSAAFRKATGLTPTAYRRQVKF